MSMTGTQVSIVIPTIDGGDWLLSCLGAVRESTRRNGTVEIVVAEDCGGRASARSVVGGLPALQGVDGGAVGFAATCNRAAASAGSPLVLFLNDDVTVGPGFLDPLLETMQDREVFAVTPRILRADPRTGAAFDESVHRSFLGFGLFYHERVDVGPSVGESAVVPIPFGCGAALLVRRDRFLALGGFDPVYAPFYWEDFDVCYRAWKRGWRTLCDRRGAVHHEHRATIARLYSAEYVETIHERNRYLCSWKNVTDPALRAVARLFLPAKRLEGLLQHRGAVTAGYRLARALSGEARRKREAERRT